MTLPPIPEDETQRLASLRSLSRDVLARQELRHLHAIRMRRLGTGLRLLVAGAVPLVVAGLALVLTEGTWRPLLALGAILAPAALTTALVAWRARVRRGRAPDWR